MSKPIQCEGHRRRGGAFTLGPVQWEQCPNDAVALVTVKQDGTTLKDSPACQVCIDEGKAGGVKYLKMKPIVRRENPLLRLIAVAQSACDFLSPRSAEVDLRRGGDASFVHRDLKKALANATIVELSRKETKAGDTKKEVGNYVYVYTWDGERYTYERTVNTEAQAKERLEELAKQGRPGTYTINHLIAGAFY